MISSSRGASTICDECVLQALDWLGRGPRQRVLRFAFRAFEVVAQTVYGLSRVILRRSRTGQSCPDFPLPNTPSESASIAKAEVCSFCGRALTQVKSLVGPGRAGAYICDECAVGALAMICRRPEESLNMRAGFRVFAAILNLAHGARTVFHGRTTPSRDRGY
jgi:hypothetical protein